MIFSKQILITEDAFWGRDGDTMWNRGRWPIHWITVANAPSTPYVALFRLNFSLENRVRVRAHVSGDERYHLSVNGQSIGRGPERGCPSHWYYETYEIDFEAGQNLLLARIEAPGPFAPAAQMSVRPGFIFAPDDETWWDRLGTGRASWEAQILGGHSYVSFTWGQYAGLKPIVDGSRIPWDIAAGAGEGWIPAEKSLEGQNARRNGESATVHAMVPAVLPTMYSDRIRGSKVRSIDDIPADKSDVTPYGELKTDQKSLTDWQGLFDGKARVQLPAQSHHRVLVDLDNYYCFFPTLVLNGGLGSRVSLSSIEALFCEPSQIEGYASGTKANRNQIVGNYFRGAGCVVIPDGKERRYAMSDWLAGRYVQLLVTVGSEPLEILGIELEETRYPLEMTAQFSSGSDLLDPIIPLMVRSLQMCTHETYMDCPYYEQLMYVGDSRLEALVTYAISGDERMPRKSIDLFSHSRSSNGLTWSRYPCKCPQWIPPFSLLWAAMVSDFAWWRGDANFVRGHLPGVRNVLDTFLLNLNEDGLVVAPQGWNFMDWVPSWKPAGIPPGADQGVNGSINWLLVLVLQLTAEVEKHFGDDEMAFRWQRRATRLARNLDKLFWNESRGLYSEDANHEHFSEHAQCLALLSGLVQGAKKIRLAKTLFSDPDLARTTIYFSHYLFETCAQLDRMDVLFERMKLWGDLPAQGFKTTPENPEPSRSDCHAWGAHPLYHYFASILGIRPAAPGFKEISIRPQLGPLQSVRGVMPTPQGDVSVAFTRKAHGLQAEVILPKNTCGSLISPWAKIPLAAGRQELFLNLTGSSINA